MNWFLRRLNEKTTAAGLGIIGSALSNIAQAPNLWAAQMAPILSGALMILFPEASAQAPIVSNTANVGGFEAGKHFVVLIFAGGLMLTLSACGQSPQQIMYEVRSGYDATVLAPAVSYAKLPPCQEGGSAVCKDAAVLAKIKKADADAKAVLDAAENTVRTSQDATQINVAIQAAKDAVVAVQSILNNHNIH